MYILVPKSERIRSDRIRIGFAHLYYLCRLILPSYMQATRKQIIVNTLKKLLYGIVLMKKLRILNHIFLLRKLQNAIIDV
jgi:hypothetical protein